MNFFQYKSKEVVVEHLKGYQMPPMSTYSRAFGPLDVDRLLEEESFQNRSTHASLRTFIFAMVAIFSMALPYSFSSFDVQGPSLKPDSLKHFSFSGIGPKNHDVNLNRFYELTPFDAHRVILNSMPYRFRLRLAPYLSTVLHYASKYKIDPFWVLSIMWTESHFNIDAVSKVKAQGLMQVMPDTALHIGLLLKKKMERKVLLEYAKSPKGNIEFGVFYLSKLLKKFKGNHKLATIAYNMGPYWVIKRLRYNRPVGVKNLYLNKVNRAYRRVTRNYKKWEKSFPSLASQTLVVSHHSKVTESHYRDLLAMLPSNGQKIKLAYKF